MTTEAWGGEIPNIVRTVQKTKTRFINPFDGRAKALELSGLFLFDPTVEMKLSGNPLRALYVEMEKESLYKRLERAAKLGMRRPGPWLRACSGLLARTGVLRAPPLSALASRRRRR